MIAWLHLLCFKFPGRYIEASVRFSQPLGTKPYLLTAAIRDSACYGAKGPALVAFAAELQLLRSTFQSTDDAGIIFVPRAVVNWATRQGTKHFTLL